jgi:hypothetical protein
MVPQGVVMNITAIAALACLILWIVLVFVAHLPSGYPHLLYAAGMTLLARRVLVGAPTFKS